MPKSAAAFGATAASAIDAIVPSTWVTVVTASTCATGKRPLVNRRRHARFVEAEDQEADHRAEREGQRRPHVELRDRQRDEQAAEERPDDRAQPPDAELPARAVRAKRRRVDECAVDVDARLDTQDAETGEEGGDE